MAIFPGPAGIGAAETLQFTHNLGCALVMRNAQEGIAELQVAWKGRGRTLGQAHPDTLETAQALGASLFTAGDDRSAFGILQAAYGRARMSLGGAHPVTRSLAANLDIVARRRRH